MYRSSDGSFLIHQTFNSFFSIKFEFRKIMSSTWGVLLLIRIQTCIPCGSFRITWKTLLKTLTGRVYMDSTTIYSRPRLNQNNDPEEWIASGYNITFYGFLQSLGKLVFIDIIDYEQPSVSCCQLPDPTVHLLLCSFFILQFLFQEKFHFLHFTSFGLAAGGLTS